MAKKSLSDVPNRVVRLFLEQAGLQYDVDRDLRPFKGRDRELLERFRNRCAYCGGDGGGKRLVIEHMVPMNRTHAGLDAWGNVVPACTVCNYEKSGAMQWREHPELNDERRAALEKYVEDYRYSPDVEELKVVLEKLYELSDKHTRSLIEFSIIAARPFLTKMATTSGLVTGPEVGGV